jgi:hypothetical protein
VSAEDQEAIAMNTSEFVDALRDYSFEECVRSVEEALTSLNRPQGLAEQQLQNWYKSLASEGATSARYLIRYSAASMLFKLLVVLDNCDAIEGGEDKGELVLRYERGSSSIRLGDPPNFLHDNLPGIEDLMIRRRP